MLRMIQIITLLGCCVAMGCGDEHHDEDGHGASHAQEACEHMADTASGAETTTAAGSADTTNDRTKDTADKWLHKRHKITLPSQGSAYEGFVNLEVPHAGVHHLFSDTEVTVKIAGKAASSSGLVAECTEVNHMYEYNLPVGKHVMQINASQATVSLVLEFPSEDDGHDHD